MKYAGNYLRNVIHVENEGAKSFAFIFLVAVVLKRFWSVSVSNLIEAVFESPFYDIYLHARVGRERERERGGGGRQIFFIYRNFTTVIHWPVDVHQLPYIFGVA